MRSDASVCVCVRRLLLKSRRYLDCDYFCIYMNAVRYVHTNTWVSFCKVILFIFKVILHKVKMIDKEI